MKGMQINPGRKSYYEKMGWWGTETLLDYWHTSVSQYGEREYVVDNRGNRVTYKQMDILSDRLAGWLYMQGIRPMDVMTIQIPIWHEFVVATLAGLKIGAVVNPIGMTYEGSELWELLRLLGTKAFLAPTFFRGIDRSNWPEHLKAEVPSLKTILLIENEGHRTEGPLYRNVLEAPQPSFPTPPSDANEVCAILCTSGTTAGPKAVMFTHNNLIYSELQFGRILDLTKEDIMFMPAPLNHATGFHHGIICNMLYGAKVVFQERFNRTTAIDYMNEEKCTYSMGATPFIYDILKELDATGKSLPYLKYYLCGGAPLPGILVNKAWERHKVLVCEVYGSTESTPHVLVRPSQALSNYGMTAGRPIPGTEIKIVDDNRHIRCYGFPGEEASRGPGVFVGYYNNEAATCANLDEDGWFYSGDMGIIDARGNLKIIGRKKDIIIRGGENLSINEIAKHLIDFPDMDDFAILGCPDERMGERICAYMVPGNGASITKERVIEFLKGKSVSKRYWPERVELIDAIPRTESGKIKRYLLENDVRKRMGLLE